MFNLKRVSEGIVKTECKNGRNQTNKNHEHKIFIYLHRQEYATQNTEYKLNMMGYIQTGGEKVEYVHILVPLLGS